MIRSGFKWSWGINNKLEYFPIVGRLAFEIFIPRSFSLIEAPLKLLLWYNGKLYRLVSIPGRELRPHYKRIVQRNNTKLHLSSVGRGCRIHPTASLQMGKTPPPTSVPGYDTKLPVGETPVLELWGMWSIPSLPLLQGPLWPGVVVPDSILSMNQIELSANKWLMLNWIVNVTNTCTWHTEILDSCFDLITSHQQCIL